MANDDKDKSLVPATEKMLPVSNELIDPDQQVAWGQKAAKALMAVVSTKKKPVMMGGEQYLEYEDWQVLARFYNYTVGTDWTKEINREGKIFGFESRAVVRNMSGVVVSSAEASCLRDEPKWNTRTKYGYVNGRREKIGEELVPEFQLKSMAQTRACAKALRNVLAWVVTLAGYKPTPAEEIDNLAGDNGNSGAAPVIEGQFGEPIDSKPPFPSKPKASPSPGAPVNQSFKKPTLKCADCGDPISAAESSFSLRKFGKELCRKDQAAYQG